MRPIAADQNYLRNPLNELLGTPANVRLIRMLAEDVGGQIGAPEAAEHTGLTEAGARRALKRLASTGFVERLGGGRAQRFRLRDSDPLIGELLRLFKAEKERYRAFSSDLREALRELPEVELAWIDDPPSGPGQPLHLGVLASSDVLLYLEEEIRRRIIDVESRFDVTIEIHAFSRADAPDLDWEVVDVVGGDLPLRPGAPQPTPPDHSQRLGRATRVSRVVAELLDRDPSLIRRAQEHLTYLLSQDQGSARHDLGEWQQILAHYSRQRLKDFLIADTPRAQRLRQSSPFFAVLGHNEREAVLEAIERNDS